MIAADGTFRILDTEFGIAVATAPELRRGGLGEFSDESAEGNESCHCSYCV